MVRRELMCFCMSGGGCEQSVVRFACISSSAAWQVKLEGFGGIKMLSKVSLSSSVDGRSMLVIAWALFFFFFSTFSSLLAERKDARPLSDGRLSQGEASGSEGDRQREVKEGGSGGGGRSVTERIAWR